MKFYKKNDILIIAFIMVIAIISYFAYKAVYQDKHGIAEIYYGSQLIMTVDLDEGVDRTFSVPQNKNVIFHLFEDGTIRFEESDCPDKVCINTGRVGMVGESAACLPNNLILKIVPSGKANQDDHDMIIGK